MQYGGQTITDICTYPGQTIVWQEADQSAQYLLLFLTTPFTSNTFYFTGRDNNKFPGHDSGSPANACSEFSIRQQVGSTIYYWPIRRWLCMAREPGNFAREYVR